MEEKIHKLTLVPSRLSQQVIILRNKNKRREFLIHKKCPPQLEHAHLPIEGDLKGYLSGRSTLTFHTPFS